MTLTEKKSRLETILRELGSFVIAFSGGVDSSLLLYIAHLQKEIRLMAVTIRTPYMPEREIKEATQFASQYSINHKIIDIPFPEIIRNNPLERCYLCKKTLFRRVADYAEEHGYHHIVDGTNYDDKSDYRPGLKALKEEGIRSPLAEAGLTKNDIRELARASDLIIWDKPAMACLLTRIPYNTVISEDNLRMIEKAEDLLFDRGYPGTRVRTHGNLARIECMPGYLEKIIHDPEKFSLIADLKKIGFRYISLDLEGYKTGSMNPEKNQI